MKLNLFKVIFGAILFSPFWVYAQDGTPPRYPGDILVFYNLPTTQILGVSQYGYIKGKGFVNCNEAGGYGVGFNPNTVVNTPLISIDPPNTGLSWPAISWTMVPSGINPLDCVAPATPSSIQNAPLVSFDYGQAVPTYQIVGATMPSASVTFSFKPNLTAQTQPFCYNHQTYNYVGCYRYQNTSQLVCQYYIPGNLPPCNK